MKLTYWVAQCLDDSTAYSYRAKTKKECQRLYEQNPEGYAPPKKVTIEYSDGFDLLCLCSDEARLYWED